MSTTTDTAAPPAGAIAAPAVAITIAPAAKPTIERKAFDFEVKVSGDGPGRFDLYAAVFNNVDNGNDRIHPGAVENLKEFERDGWFGVSHNWQSLPYGMIDSAEQDAYGFRIKGPFHSTVEAQACRTVMAERAAAGKSVRASIGYEATKVGRSTVEGKSVRDLYKIKVYEVSLVNKPMNDLATLVSVKGADGGEGGADAVESKGALLGDTRVALSEIVLAQMLKLLAWKLRSCLQTYGREILAKCGFDGDLFGPYYVGPPIAAADPEPFYPSAAIAEAGDAIDEFRAELTASLEAIYRIPQTVQPAGQGGEIEMAGAATPMPDDTTAQIKAAAARLADSFGWSPAATVTEAPGGAAGTATPFWDTSAKLAADATEFVRVARKRYEIRHAEVKRLERKVGQELSSANRGKLQQLLDALDMAAADIRDLLDRTTPQPRTRDGEPEPKGAPIPASAPQPAPDLDLKRRRLQLGIAAALVD